jgi:RNA polymerase sigma factor (sigma-70 family)
MPPDRRSQAAPAPPPQRLALPGRPAAPSPAAPAPPFEPLSPFAPPSPEPLPALPPPLLDPGPPPFGLPSSTPQSGACTSPRPSHRAAHPTDLELSALQVSTRAALLALFRESRLSPPDTEDLMQEALLIVWLRWPAIEDAPAFLLGTVKNRIHHYAERRRLDRECRVPFEPELLERLAPAAFTHNPQRRLDSHHDARRLLARLSAGSRRIVALRHAHQLPARDVALRVGASETAVRQTARRGLLRLRRYARAQRSRL